MIFEVLKLGLFLQIRVLENEGSPGKSEGLVAYSNALVFCCFFTVICKYFHF